MYHSYKAMFILVNFFLLCFDNASSWNKNG